MRKTKAKKRILLPDPKFNEVLVTRFVNNLMKDDYPSRQVIQTENTICMAGLYVILAISIL